MKTIKKILGKKDYKELRKLPFGKRNYACQKIAKIIAEDLRSFKK